jgi:4-hydroxybenzoate polyprenyltransferase
MIHRFVPYFQLVRLPNVFTAMADIILAGLAVGALPERWPAFVLLLLASCCLYCSGMVWNDIFDRRQDEKERPFRPIPSGRVKLPTAILFAMALMAGGVALALAVDTWAGRWYSVYFAAALCAAIFLYDGWLKRTALGPIAMGSCRFLNILLGLTMAAGPIANWGFVLALVVGVYIAGVTWFARTEARDSNRFDLGCAFAVMIAGILLAVTLPVLVPFARDDDTNRLVNPHVWWGQLLLPYLLIGFLIYLSIPIITAINHPLPEKVQQAVKRSILGLVLLDAILATTFVGPLGLALAVLLWPSFWLGRRLYST